MRFLSVCSGIEAASAAWRPLGWEAVAFSEIEPFPCSVLAHHYPTVPNRGDMTKFQEWPDEPIDLLCGGTPCQSFSVAGLRKGLADPRGNLMLTFGAIAAKYRPRWLVWENVPGVLSSNGGADFGAFLGMLGELGYGFAYRVLDAQYFGVPQRRRRVFVVGCLGDWRSAAAVLFERHSMSGHPAPRRQAGQGTAASTAPSLTASGRGVERCGESRGQDPVVAVVAGTLNANGKAAGSATQQDAEAGMLPPVALCLNAHGGGRYDAESETLIPTTGGGFDVAHALTGEGFDASEDGTGRGTPLVPIYTPEVAATMVARSSRGGGQTNSPGHQADGELVAIAFDCKASGRNGFGVGDIASTQRAMGHAGSHTNGGGHQAVAIGADCWNGSVTGDVAATMGTRGSSETASGPTLLRAMQVRRLTPEECEALQGFPRGYSQVPHRGKPAADGPRYKALGNSWAVPCAAWIGRRIEAVEAVHRNAKAAA